MDGITTWRNKINAGNDRNIGNYLRYNSAIHADERGCRSNLMVVQLQATRGSMSRRLPHQLGRR